MLRSSCRAGSVDAARGDQHREMDFLQGIGPVRFALPRSGSAAPRRR